MGSGIRERPEYLRQVDKRLFIDGSWCDAASGERVETVNPADGRVVATLARGGEADVDAAVRAARKAFEGPWRDLSPADRQALLLRVHDIVDRRWDELALIETTDMGAPLSRTRQMRPAVLQIIRFFASQTQNATGETIPNSLPGRFSTMTVKAPIGVVGGIIPWNGPLYSQWWILGGVLATGCTAVMKPSEEASLSVLRTAEILSEAGLPPGVVNVVTGLGTEAGAALAAHPDVNRVAFTGSTATGREIIKASAGNIKRLSLELGGKSPDIVFSDADLDRAVPGAAMGIFSNSGQICYAGTRIFVQASIRSRFVERFVDFTRGLRVGEPIAPESQLGPLVSERQLSRVMDYVDLGRHEGAKLVAGGARMGGTLARGYYVEPTVFDGVHNGMRIAREEIFGPVASIIPFDDVDDALRLANDSDYGLGGAVWTESLRTATTMMHGIEAGQVWVNCYGAVDLGVGFGGFKHSGYGWKGGRDHIDAFLYKKAITIRMD